MKALIRRRWQRWKFCTTGLLLVAPCWYFYQGLNPVFPPEWPERAIGPFTAAPMPLDEAPPYPHDGAYVKDFSLRFCEGCVARIRTAQLNVGSQPAPLSEAADGILHGSSTAQHVHAPYPLKPAPDDRLWLTVQEWNGRLHHASWPLPR